MRQGEKVEEGSNELDQQIWLVIFEDGPETALNFTLNKTACSLQTS